MNFSVHLQVLKEEHSVQGQLFLFGCFAVKACSPQNSSKFEIFPEQVCL